MLRALLTNRRPANSSRDIIFWWERLRWVYNAAVGTAGLLIVLGYILVAYLYNAAAGAPLGIYHFVQLAIPVVIYGVGANIAYTTGWLTEVIVHRYTDMKTDDYAMIFFVGGTVLSVLLTLAPAIFLLAFGLIGLLFQVY